MFLFFIEYIFVKCLIIMKKCIFIIILLSTLCLSSCNKNYNIGNTITKDNVSYTLYDAKNLGEKVYTKETTDYISS